MKNKNVFVVSWIIIAITTICMGINRFIAPFPDAALRIIGSIMLIDLFVLILSTAKLKSISK